MRRTKQEAEETRLGIMAKALELFSEQGIGATSLSQIANSAGVTRGAIYWHFKDKWDLFDAIWQHYSKPIEQLGQASQDEEESDPLGKLEELLKLLLVSAEQDPNFQRMLIMCMRETSVWGGELPERIAQFIDALYQRRVSTLKNAIKKGQLPENLDVEAGAMMIRVMIEGVLVNALQQPQRFPLVERADQIVDSVLLVLRQGLRRPDLRQD